MSSLKKQALHGAFWSFTERFGQQGVQFFISIILARLLEPEDFGVLGMIMIFSALAQSVVDSGFGMALIHKQDADHTDESTVFWFNLLAGLVMAGTLFFAAPWIAGFYNVPLLKPITQVFSLNLIINSFGIVQNSLLIKELAFKKRMKPILASVFISGLVGIFMAFHGFGIWSLVVQGLVMNGVKTLGLWVVHPWRPAFVFSGESFRTLWKFGSNLLFSGLLNTFFDNIYLVIIGRLYSAADLGFYQRGKRLMILTSQSLTKVVAQVNFPLLSRMQDDPVRMRGAFSKVLQSTMLVILPMMTGMAVVAPNFVYVLLGEKWMPCVPYLQILCIIGTFFPLHVLNLNVITALGRSDLFFRLEVIKKIMVVINIAITWRYGIVALLWGQVVCNILGLGINTFYVHRFLKYGLLAQLNSIKKIVVASLLMAGVIGWVNYTFSMPVFAMFLLQVVLGGMVFIALLWLFRDRVFLEGLASVGSSFKKERK